MKFKRIQFPGKTLIVSSLDNQYNAFTLYFLKLWADKFATRPDFNRDTPLAREFSSPAQPPGKFLACVRFLLRSKYQTIVFLNPDLKTDRPLKWAARLLFLKHRAGFAPLKGISAFNYSLPFNTENHHYVHQLKIFFEYLVGEKIHDWKKPGITPDTGDSPAAIPADNYGVIAIDLANPATAHLIDPLIKFINLTTRNLHLVLVIDRPEKNNTGASPHDLARQVSGAMTERAVAVTELVINPTEAQKLQLAREAAWVTGTDAESLNLAALLGTPNLSIFGPLNERVWQPFATRSRVLAGDFSCRPCTQLPGKVTCTNATPWLCMSGITGELMVGTLTGMLQRKAKPGAQPV